MGVIFFWSGRCATRYQLELRSVNSNGDGLDKHCAGRLIRFAKRCPEALDDVASRQKWMPSITCMEACRLRWSDLKKSKNIPPRVIEGLPRIPKPLSKLIYVKIWWSGERFSNRYFHASLQEIPIINLWNKLLCATRTNLYTSFMQRALRMWCSYKPM